LIAELQSSITVGDDGVRLKMEETVRIKECVAAEAYRQKRRSV
jgi:hypothetical protein